MINRTKTYENIKKNFGLKSLSQKQVEGFEAIFNEFEVRKMNDLRMLSYILSTIWHEVGKTMQPIEEIGKGKGLKYGKRFWYDGRIYTDVPHVYYGRGLTQNTWRDIYEKLTKANTKGWDFVNNPELLLKMEQSVWATFYAMTTGLYTGRKLSQYFNNKVIDPIGARKIINGTDKAELISCYYSKFLKSIAPN
jgi:putative chitinase